MQDFPKGDEFKSLQRDLKRALDNLERQMLVVKQFEDVVGRRRKLSLFHRVHGVYKPTSFEDSLVDVVKRLGPIKSHTLRFFVTKSYEDLTVALMNLEKSGKIAKVVSLVPEPEAFYCMPEEVELLKRPSREDGKLRILTQSDPYVSRFIWEVRSILDRGWYLPVFKGVDPIGKAVSYTHLRAHETQ